MNADLLTLPDFKSLGQACDTLNVALKMTDSNSTFSLWPDPSVDRRANHSTLHLFYAFFPEAVYLKAISQKGPPMGSCRFSNSSMSMLKKTPKLKPPAREEVRGAHLLRVHYFQHIQTQKALLLLGGEKKNSSSVLSVLPICIYRGGFCFLWDYVLGIESSFGV